MAEVRRLKLSLYCRLTFLYLAKFVLQWRGISVRLVSDQIAICDNMVCVDTARSLRTQMRLILTG